MRVGVIDVGSNTVRLLVAARTKAGLSTVSRERVTLGLGACIERSGAIPAEKLEETALCVRSLSALAHESGADVLEVLVTSPGRQATNGEALVAAVARAAGAPAWQLTGEDEGRLAYEGALALEAPGDVRVAVCDVGGGSTQLTIGSGPEPEWARSFDIGSLRLTRRALAQDPPRRRALAASRRVVEDAFADVTPPPVEVALAVGGSARALRRLAGRTLDQGTLSRALTELARRPAAESARLLALDETRAETLLAGTVILSEVQRRLDVPLRIARGGLREGAALQLLRFAAAA